MQHVVYEFEMDDMVAFGDHHTAHDPYFVSEVQKKRWISVILFAGLAFIGYERTPKLSVTMGMLGLAFFLFYASLIRWLYRRQNRRLLQLYDPAYFSRGELILENHQLRKKSAAGESILKITTLNRVEETPSYYFIYAGPIHVIVVPKQRILSGDMQALATELSQSIPMKSF